MRATPRLSRQVFKGPILVVAFTSFAVCAPVQATVYEFNAKGEVTVTETPPKFRAPNRNQAVPPANEPLRSLARDVALRFSGTAGVRKAGLDALTFIEVFEALIDAESSFNPKAVSEDGAQGLGQLMPKTASDMKVADSFDPKQNLIGSAQYFTILLERFGSLDLALAAYNAGPERVKQYDGIPPFPETRSYIAAILKDVGLPELPNTAPLSDQAVKAVKPVSNPDNKEQPLKGETSVWEF